MASSKPQPGDPAYRAPASEMDPFPERNRTALQEHNAYAFEHKDDGFFSPVSSGGPAPDVRIKATDDAPPRHSGIS